MVVIISTHTEPINPPSASPVLTHAQFWDGVVYGLRNNHLLVPTIKEAKVLSHTDEELVLLQTLEEHPMLGHNPGEHKNRFTLSPPCKVCKPCYKLRLADLLSFPSIDEADAMHSCSLMVPITAPRIFIVLASSLKVQAMKRICISPLVMSGMKREQREVV